MIYANLQESQAAPQVFRNFGIFKVKDNKLSDLDAPVAKEDIIFIGYPVWWYREPSIIDSFLDAYDFTGKKIVLFATSGSSDIGEEAPKRVAEISGTSVLAAKRFPANVDASELKAWAEGF